ncbi:LuxR C-terminal-related transcriptional regulator [Nocardia sp. NPDC056100]|uniref:helix-turn-helix transcriptional regulator n=1 Tax=Nocardia sp. NPDC056100 TaxID=3345712 RepID=UPI0035DFD573
MTRTQLLGRAEDLAWTGALCASATSGRSAVAVLEGDAGMGKTALIAAALAEHDNFEAIAITGVEAEFELPFAALQRLVLAYRDMLDRLSETHRTALLVASGLADGVIADRLAIGVALLALVTTLSAARPVFLWVDDSQWVDEESLGVFAFVGRRLLADPVVMIYCRRPDGAGRDHLAGLPTRTLAGLDVATSITLLRSMRGEHGIERAIAAQIAVATGGNPLALRDLGDELTQRQLEGVALLPEPVPLGTHLQANYLRLVRRLPEHCQRWLLLAAAEADGNLRTVSAAAELAGLPRDASTPAELAELVTVADRIVFRHPLIRSAIYAGGTAEQRRDTHLRLSRASTELDLEQRALLHRAAVADGIDDELADLLENAAAASGQRGDFATRTRLLLRAAQACTGERRARRLLAAVQSAMFSGAIQQARAVMDEIDERFLGEDRRAELTVLRAEGRLPALEPGAFGARATALVRLAEALDTAGRHADAVGAVGMGIRGTWLSAHLTVGTTTSDLAEVALRLVDADAVNAPALSMRAYGEFILNRPGAADTYRAAAQYFLEHPSAALPYLYSYSGVVDVAGTLIDDASRDGILAGIEQCARRDSSGFLLANIVSFRAHFDIQAGRVAQARARVAETVVLLGASGYPEDHLTLRALRAGIRGWTAAPALDSKQTAAEIEECRDTAFGAGVELWQRAELLEQLAAGSPADAWDTARALLTVIGEPNAWLAIDLIEAAVHAEEFAIATELGDRLEHRSRVLDTPLGAGLRALARAAAANEPEALYRTAIERLAHADTPMYAARAHLRLGEWLRRQRRRTDAATHLEQAAAIFTAQGATSWSARTARELAPLGIASAPPRTQRTALTAQEETIANLAGRGATNQEIADQLFLSASTVDYHLRKVFRKLDVTSRRQLAAAME